MARRNRKNRRAAHSDAARNIVVPAHLRDSYRELVHAVQASQVEAGVEQAMTHRAVQPDLHDALSLLNSNPALLSYLKGVVQREQAIAQANGENDIPFAISYAVPGMERDFAPQVWGKFGPPTGSHPQDQGGLGGWTTGGSHTNQPQEVPNANQLRYLADTNEWVRAAINTRRQQIGRAEIDIVPADERKVWDRKLLNRVKQLLEQPNELRDSYRTLIEPVIEDILVLDRGCISKNMSPKREPVYLYYEDGATIKVYTAWDGKPRSPRYLYEEPGGTKKVPLFNDELICISANPATYRVGLAPVQWLRATINAEMRAIKSAEHYVDMKPPPHLVQVPGAHQTQITQLRNNYDAEVAGRKELFWMGGDQQAHVFPLTSSARENQWLEWQQYLARKIATAFQISPQQFGFVGDVNRATGMIQQEIFEDTGLIPLMLLLEEYLNRELLMDFAPIGKDGRANLEKLNLRIIYPQVSEAERQLHAESAAQIAQTSMAGLPSATLNQILLMRGEEPVPGGNTFWVNTKNGPVPWLSYDKEYGDWNPLASLGGMLGAQDPMGGPDTNETDVKVNTDDEKNKYNQESQQRGQAAAQAQQQAETPKAPPATGGAGAASSAPTKQPTQAKQVIPQHSGKRGHDLVASNRPHQRVPGKHWSPSYFTKPQDDDDE